MTSPTEFELWIAPHGAPPPRRIGELAEQGYRLVAAIDGVTLLEPTRTRYPIRWLDGGREHIEPGRRYLVVAQTTVGHLGRRARGVMTEAEFTAGRELVVYRNADGVTALWHVAIVDPPHPPIRQE